MGDRRGFQQNMPCLLVDCEDWEIQECGRTLACIIVSKNASGVECRITDNERHVRIELGIRTDFYRLTAQRTPHYICETALLPTGPCSRQDGIAC